MKSNFSVYKGIVKISTKENIFLNGIQNIDGITINVDDIVLVKDQINKVENGIYVVKTGSWIRNYNMKENMNISGSVIFIKEGNSNANKLYFCINESGKDKVGTNDLQFVSVDVDNEIPNTLELEKLTVKNICNFGTNSGSTLTLGKGSDSYIEIGSGNTCIINIGEGGGSLLDVCRSDYSEMRLGNSTSKIGFFGKDSTNQPDAVSLPTADVNSLKESLDKVINSLMSLGLIKSI